MTLHPKPHTHRHLPLSLSHGHLPLRTTHTPSLYTTLGGSTNAQIFKYLPSGPYFAPSSFGAWIKSLVDGEDFMYAVIPTPPPKADGQNEIKDEDVEVLGIACLSSAEPRHHAIEIGVILSPLLHHSTAGTEVSYLLLHHCFSVLGYQRVEWRCNDRNEGSKRAAERLGFVKEGVLRRQQVVKGRGRDTAVYGLLWEEWEVARRALEAWLQEGNFEGGVQKRRLADLREEMVAAREEERET